MQICKYARICKNESKHVCKCAGMQVFKYASMQVCNYASMQVYTYMQINAKLSICPQLRHFLKEDLLNLTNFGAVYLSQFLTDFSQILDSNS